jgi:UDP-N-acetylenolpyruvoylglucosamine reductase
MSTKSLQNSSSLNALRRQLEKRFSSRFLENEPLAAYVSAAVGGVAEFVVSALSAEDLVEAAKLAAVNQVEYRIVAGGTATLPSEVGFPGLIIINKSESLAIDQGTSTIFVGSGSTNKEILAASASRGYGGIEFLSGIPGTIGGAVVTNAGYDGHCIGDFVKDVTMFITEGQQHKTVTVTASELGLNPYRSLLMKSSMFPPVVLSLRLQLARLPQEEILRRLRAYRRRNDLVNSKASKIGGFFSPLLEAQTALHREVRKIRPGPGLQLKERDGIIVGTPPKTQPRDYQMLLEEIKAQAAGMGVTLEDRLTYLGYWPDEGENAAA